MAPGEQADLGLKPASLWRRAMATPAQRPTRVVIVDADNQMVEVTAKSFWREVLGWPDERRTR